MNKKATCFLLTCTLIMLSFSLHAQYHSSLSKVKINNIETGALIIENHAYTTCMDTLHNLPLFVSHAISKEILDAGDVSRERPGGYAPDPKYKNIKRDAYASSGYDHGHLAPARDFKGDPEAWKESFYMTNMAPQHGCLNQRGWCFLESLCRDWAESDSANIIYIVTGTIPGEYIDTLCYGNGSKVFVPSKFFKAVLSYNPEQKKAKAIGFVVPNESVDNEDIPTYACTIDSLEQLTGLDLFYSLRNGLERRVEKRIGEFLLEGESECPKKDCGSVYLRRVLPEDRSKLRCD